MSLFRHEAGLIRPQAHNRDEVIASLELSGLDPDTTLVLGGGALSLAGLRKAHDVDVMTPALSFDNLLRNQKTPSGLPVSPLENGHIFPFVTIHTSRKRNDALAVDVTSPLNPNNLSPAELDEEYLRQLASFDKFTVSGYRYMPPEMVKAQKIALNEGKHLRRKDQRDIHLINRYLEAQRHNKAA